MRFATIAESGEQARGLWGTDGPGPRILGFSLGRTSGPWFVPTSRRCGALLASGPNGGCEVVTNGVPLRAAAGDQRCFVRR